MVLLRLIMREKFGRLDINYFSVPRWKVVRQPVPGTVWDRKISPIRLGIKRVINWLKHRLVKPKLNRMLEHIVKLRREEKMKCVNASMLRVRGFWIDVERIQLGRDAKKLYRQWRSSRNFLRNPIYPRDPLVMLTVLFQIYVRVMCTNRCPTHPRVKYRWLCVIKLWNRIM